MAVASRKYNPGFLTDDELVGSFCVRTAEFDSAIEMLRECDGSANPHRIVIGQRGSGKTSLLLRIAAEIRRDDDLARRFHPIVFAEESYEVSTVGEFWLECLSRLADRAPTGEDAADLRRTIEDLRTVPDDRALGDRCLVSLLDFADRIGRRLVLMVENLGSMFGEMADADAGWRLRQTLQTEPRILLLASSNSRFDEIDNPDRALYDLFRIVPLRPLDREECAVLWERTSGRCRDPDSIRPLQILTGGSPRLIAILGRFGAGLSFRELMAELLDLIDDHTEYFRSHLEALPAQERRVYLALADLWKPATTREIAHRARLDTSKCSAQLNRLIERGVVEVAGGKPRRKQYYLTERLYNIYYLMRRSRGPEPMVEALVRFMEAFYSPGELADLGSRLACEDGIDAEVDVLRQLTLKRQMETPGLATFRDEVLADIPAELAKGVARATGPSGLAGATANGATRSHESTSSVGKGVTVAEGRHAAWGFLEEAFTLSRESRVGDALARLDEAIGQFRDADTPEAPETVASALVLKGDILAGLVGPEDRGIGFPEAVYGVRDGETVDFSDLMAMALTGKESGLKRAPEALLAYDDVLGRFGGSDVPAVMEQVARALIHKAVPLHALDRTDEALEALDKVIARFGTSHILSLVETVADALCMKGIISSTCDRGTEAVALLDEAKRRLWGHDAPGALQRRAIIFYFQGIMLVQLGRTEEALAAWDEAVKSFTRIESPASSEMVAETLVRKATTLAGCGQFEEALTAWDESLRHCDALGSPAVSEIAAKALVNRACMLGRLNRVEEALADYNEFMQRYGEEEGTAFPELLASALFGMGAMLEALNRHDEALDVFDDVVDRFGSSDSPPILEAVAGSLSHKAHILESVLRPEEALAVLDEMVRRFGKSDVPVIVSWAANALLRKGKVLHILNRPQEALGAFGAIMRRFGERQESEFAEPVSAALIVQGFALSATERLAEALFAFEEAVGRLAGNDAPGAFALVALACVGKGLALRKLNRPKEALKVLEKAVNLLDQSECDSVRDTLGPVLVDKAALELRCHRYAAAVETADRALDPILDPSPKNRLRAHVIRVKATLSRDQASSCQEDIKSILALLAEVSPLSVEAMELLMSLCVALGPRDMHSLIQASPAASLLSPLVTALEWELGMTPRVAREVEEVARDIRKSWRRGRTTEFQASD